MLYTIKVKDMSRPVKQNVNLLDDEDDDSSESDDGPMCLVGVTFSHFPK